MEYDRIEPNKLIGDKIFMMALKQLTEAVEMQKRDGRYSVLGQISCALELLNECKQLLDVKE